MQLVGADLMQGAVLGFRVPFGGSGRRQGAMGGCRVPWGVPTPRCPPTAAQGVPRGRGDKSRIFRAERSYAVRAGKWYFEFEAVTTGEMRVGWARPHLRPDTELGADDLAYVFNGHRVRPPGTPILPLGPPLPTGTLIAHWDPHSPPGTPLGPP